MCFTKQLLALLREVLSDIFCYILFYANSLLFCSILFCSDPFCFVLFCSIPFHSIKIAGCKLLKWFKNPISYNPQCEKHETEHDWVKSVSGVAMLNRDKTMSLTSWCEQNISSQPHSCPYNSIPFGGSLSPMTHKKYTENWYFHNSSPGLVAKNFIWPQWIYLRWFAGKVGGVNKCSLVQWFLNFTY